MLQERSRAAVPAVWAMAWPGRAIGRERQRVTSLDAAIACLRVAAKRGDDGGLRR